MLLRLVMPTLVILSLAIIRFSAPALSQNLENPLRVKMSIVSHETIGTTVIATFDISITNTSDAPVAGINLRANSLGGTPVTELQAPNLVTPLEVFVGDLEPYQTHEIEDVWMSFEGGDSEPGLTWDLEFIAPYGELVAHQIIY